MLATDLIIARQFRFRKNIQHMWNDYINEFT